jgi:hypothetical protein
MIAGHQTFVITLRPEKHCLDPIRALRATLKNALRAHGLRCLTINKAELDLGTTVPKLENGVNKADLDLSAVADKFKNGARE